MLIERGESPASLRRAGRRVTSVAKSISWRTPATEAEYQAVVSLRMRAYAGAGKVAPGDTRAMRDEFDRRAIILTAWHHEKPVASLRIMPHGPGDAWEHEKYVSLDHPALPSKDVTAEITRVCTDPEWRGTDLPMLLFQRTALDLLRLGRTHLLGSSTVNLLPLYERIGCVQAPIDFTYEELGALVHRVFYCDVARSLRGGVLPWAAWSVMWSDVYAEAVRSGLLRPGPLGLRARVKAWSIASPALRLADRAVRRARR